MSFKTMVTVDVENVFLNETEFGESGAVVTNIGASFTISFVRSGTTDQLLMEPGYADTDTFSASKAKYPEPKTGDTITDSDGVVWLVEPGSKLNMGLWSIPVKSDRRVRS